MAANTKARSRPGKKAPGKRETDRSLSVDCSDTSVDDKFRAFSDRTRLRILHLLLRGETCVGDLVQVLELSQPRVSQQLSCLRNAGLVVGRKEGQWMHYSLAKPNTPFHRQLIKCLKLCFSEVPELRKDEVRAEALDQQGHCCSTRG